MTKAAFEFFKLPHFNSHFVIVANGHFLVNDIVQEVLKQKCIVALDGAADKLASLGIIPHVIVGDFDSIESLNKWGIEKTFDEITENDKPYLGANGVTIVPAKNQNFTDLIKAIHYCDSLGAKHIDIVCAHGRRMDHHEENVRALRSQYKKERPLFLHTDQQSLRFATNEKIVIRGQALDKCGILAFPVGKFSSTGLLYDGDNYPLEMGYSESVCNSLKGGEAHISIEGEVLIVMPPVFQSQREFSKKSLVERLELELSDAKRFALGAKELINYDLTKRSGTH